MFDRSQSLLPFKYAVSRKSCINLSAFGVLVFVPLGATGIFCVCTSSLIIYCSLSVLTDALRNSCSVVLLLVPFFRNGCFAHDVHKSLGNLTAIYRLRHGMHCMHCRQLGSSVPSLIRKDSKLDHKRFWWCRKGWCSPSSSVQVVSRPEGHLFAATSFPIGNLAKTSNDAAPLYQNWHC